MELIDREAFLKAWNEKFNAHCEESALDNCLNYEGCVECIAHRVPAIDAVPVIRCKDCKHWLKDVAGCTEPVGHCEWANWMVGENGYCVYGEKGKK